MTYERKANKQRDEPESSVGCSSEPSDLRADPESQDLLHSPHVFHSSAGKHDENPLSS